MQRDHNRYQGYVKENFDVYGFMNGKFDALNTNAISRMENALAKAINQHKLLPKFVVVVPDDDLIKFYNRKGYGISTALGRIVDSIMVEHDRLVTAYKEFLPEKCKKEEYPHFIWILAPIHNNFANNSDRHKFNKCVERMAKFHKNTHALQLKKIWNLNNSNLFIRESRRFTTTGYNMYWEAVDRTVKYCDTILMKKVSWEKAKSNVRKLNPSRGDRYRWSKNQHSSDGTMEAGNINRRKLPSPPPRHDSEV